MATRALIDASIAARPQGFSYDPDLETSEDNEPLCVGSGQQSNMSSCSGYG